MHILLFRILVVIISFSTNSVAASIARDILVQRKEKSDKTAMRIKDLPK